MKISPRITLACLLLLGTNLQAQLTLTPAKPDVRKPEGVSLRAICADVSAMTAPATWGVIGPEGEIVPFKVVLGSLSMPAIQKFSNRIQIYDLKALQEAFAAKTDKSTSPSLPKPLIDVPVPNGAVQCLLVVQSDPNGWKCQVFDESSKDYPGGSRLLLNLTPYKLDGKCGDLEVNVAPKGFGFVAPKPTSEGYFAAIQIFAEMPTRRAPVLDQTWAFDPHTRGIILIFEVAGGSIRTEGFSDELPSPPRK